MLMYTTSQTIQGNTCNDQYHTTNSTYLHQVQYCMFESNQGLTVTISITSYTNLCTRVCQKHVPTRTPTDKVSKSKTIRNTDLILQFESDSDRPFSSSKSYER